MTCAACTLAGRHLFAEWRAPDDRVTLEASDDVIQARFQDRRVMSVVYSDWRQSPLPKPVRRVYLSLKTQDRVWLQAGLATRLLARMAQQHPDTELYGYVEHESLEELAWLEAGAVLVHRLPNPTQRLLVLKRIHV